MKEQQVTYYQLEEGDIVWDKSLSRSNIVHINASGGQHYSDGSSMHIYKGDIIQSGTEYYEVIDYIDISTWNNLKQLLRLNHLTIASLIKERMR